MAAVLKPIFQPTGRRPGGELAVPAGQERAHARGRRGRRGSWSGMRAVSRRTTSGLQVARRVGLPGAPATAATASATPATAPAAPEGATAERSASSAGGTPAAAPAGAVAQHGHDQPEHDEHEDDLRGCRRVDGEQVRERHARTLGERRRRPRSGPAAADGSRGQGRRALRRTKSCRGTGPGRSLRPGTPGLGWRIVGVSARRSQLSRRDMPVWFVSRTGPTNAGGRTSG